MSRYVGLFVLVGFVIYLAYRFWWMGYKVGGPVVAAGVCLSLLVVGGLGLWWATRQDTGPRRKA